MGEFEAQFGVSLPVEYKRLLQTQNGGRLDLSEYDDPHGGFGEVNDFYGLGTVESDRAVAAKDPDDWEIGDLWGETRVRQRDIGPKRVPFGRDGGDNQLFLDFAVNPPAVMRFVAATRNTYKIADSFPEFIDALRRPTTN